MFTTSPFSTTTDLVRSHLSEIRWYSVLGNSKTLLIAETRKIENYILLATQVVENLPQEEEHIYDDPTFFQFSKNGWMTSQQG
ncbi:hypothetical protein LOK49_LG10G00592 [Camellia lanceoleosa]|uniref:Uncharacterized protein n=1 Tax=Camellia lanceoleosa TaxID=1840588 RepID=A0ACC0GBP4_9ERIC|nr:hypothetical protein LOK49_LG10G00592 [Camellia lanceoleosa]